MVIFFPSSFELKTNQFSGEDLFFSFCFGIHIFLGRKPTTLTAMTFFLVFTHFWTEKRWHHEIPPREPPFLATPLRLSDHLPPFSTMVHNPLHCFPLHSRLHRQQYSPTPNCFKPTILPPPLWYPSMDWRFCPLPFRSWWRWSLCYMLQMQHIPFPILFLWSNCLQLHSRNLCPQARSCLVY